MKATRDRQATIVAPAQPPPQQQTIEAVPPALPPRANSQSHVHPYQRLPCLGRAAAIPPLTLATADIRMHAPQFPSRRLPHHLTTTPSSHWHACLPFYLLMTFHTHHQSQINSYCTPSSTFISLKTWLRAMTRITCGYSRQPFSPIMARHCDSPCVQSPYQGWVGAIMTTRSSWRAAPPTLPPSLHFNRRSGPLNLLTATRRWLQVVS